MRNRLFFTSLIGALLFLASCTSDQRSKAKEQAEKTKQDIREATEGARRAAKDMARDVEQKGAEFSKRTKEEAAKVDDQMDRAAVRSKDAGRKLRSTTAELALAAKVKSALANEAGLRTLVHLGVEVEGSSVTLTGQAPTVEEKQRAAEIAARVSGVGRVTNKIEIGNL